MPQCLAHEAIVNVNICPNVGTHPDV